MNFFACCFGSGNVEDGEHSELAEWHHLKIINDEVVFRMKLGQLSSMRDFHDKILKNVVTLIKFHNYTPYTCNREFELRGYCISLYAAELQDGEHSYDPSDSLHRCEYMVKVYLGSRESFSQFTHPDQNGIRLGRAGFSIKH